jgi:hypothetical protein
VVEEEERNASLRIGVACAEACTRARAASTRRFMADWPTVSGTLGRPPPMGLRAGEEEEEDAVSTAVVEER